LQHLVDKGTDPALELLDPGLGEVRVQDPSVEAVLGSVHLERRAAFAELWASGVVEAGGGQGE
jgi:hypothetical protein